MAEIPQHFLDKIQEAQEQQLEELDLSKASLLEIFEQIKSPYADRARRSLTQLRAQAESR